jgi:hypothetical protein
VKRGLGVAAAWLLALLVATPARGASRLDELFARVDAAEPGLESYTATVDIKAGLRTFPWYGTSRSGDAYYKRPGRLELVINNMPRFISKFQHLFVGLGPTKDWTRDFNASVAEENTSTEHILLVPKNPQSRIRQIAVFLDPQSAIPSRILWTYTDGHVELDETFVDVAGHRIVAAHDVELALPAFHAYLHATVHDIAVNAPVDDAVFTGSLFLNP